MKISTRMGGIYLPRELVFILFYFDHLRVMKTFLFLFYEVSPYFTTWRLGDV